jgi:hypothetical protein
VKSRSLTSVFLKKNSVGKNWGWPTVTACHQPAMSWAYPRSPNQDTVFVTR